MVGYCVRVSPKFHFLVCSSEFWIQVCRKLPFYITTAAVKQIDKIQGPLAFNFLFSHLI